MRVGNVGRVVIESRQGADAAAHHSHRVGVTAETGEEPAHLLVHHGVAGHTVIEICLLCRCRQLTVKQQVADLEEVAMLGKLVDRVAPVQQNAFITIDVGDLGFARRRGGEARIVGKGAGVLVKRADVDDVGADGAGFDRQVDLFTVHSDFCVVVCHGMSFHKCRRSALGRRLG
jgi:hypothetical protein